MQSCCAKKKKSTFELLCESKDTACAQIISQDPLPPPRSVSSLLQSEQNGRQVMQETKSHTVSEDLASPIIVKVLVIETLVVVVVVMVAAVVMMAAAAAVLDRVMVHHLTMKMINFIVLVVTETGRHETCWDLVGQPAHN